MANHTGQKKLSRSERVDGFSSRLVKLRGFRSRTSLVAELGYNPVTYSSWEAGRTEPSLVALQTLCKYFNCTADYLLGLSDSPTSAGTVKTIGDGNSNANIDSPNAACQTCPLTQVIANQSETIKNLSEALSKK